MISCKTKDCENPKAHFQSGLCWTCFHSMTTRYTIIKTND
jgi:hypothetical protein